VKVISPGLFRTLGTALVAGRDLSWTDVYERRDVIVVSENLARELWGSADAALGRRIREYYDPRSPWREIVGVSANVFDDGVHQAAPTTLYVPAQPVQRLFGLAGFVTRRVNVVVRSRMSGGESLLTPMHQAVWAVSPTLPLSQVRTLDAVYDDSMARTSFALLLLAIAGSMALLLGLFGIYGVISYAVSRRRREIGIRLALGARARDIRWMFLSRGVVLGAIGVAAGLAAAAGLTRLMRSLLFGIRPFDLATFAVMAVTLGATAVLASYLPARRAVAIDPVESMRTE
jgi:predicted lysophospholipase L1 biosynthesis ABC-type transport system permease subunit